jgi:predicted GNAT superfamily acetyltransferase
MSADTIAIRPLVAPEEFEQGVEMQKTVWGFEDVDLVPLRLFVVAAKIGGQVFGAFDGAQMVGFVMSLPAYRNRRAYLHSHMTAVAPAYQGQGLGRRLKLEQRREAMARGVELVEWTFDPLEFRNAYFNLERLGVTCCRYVRNLYGRTSSPLHGGLPTDRLVAEWWLAAPRVEAALRGERKPHRAEAERVLVPAAIHEVKKHDPATGEQMQSEVREQFEKWFGRGYTVTGFEPGEAGGTYLLEPFRREK